MVAVGVIFSNNFPFLGLSSWPVVLFLNTNPASIKLSPFTVLTASLLKLYEEFSKAPNWVPFKKVFFLKSPFVNESVLIVYASFNVPHWE